MSTIRTTTKLYWQNQLSTGRRDGMKKAIITALVLMLALVGATVTAGCGGGNTEQARKYMEQADQIANQRGSLNTELLNAWKTTRESTDPTAKAAAWQQAESTYNEILALVQKEKAEYEKIKGLKGVDDYAKYAELKIQALTAYDQMLKATHDFLQKLYNNGFASQQELDAANQAYQAESKKLQAEYEQASNAAEQLKKEKNL
jgi:hypothetical protein